VDIELYNVHGQLIRTSNNQKVTPGTNQLIWDVSNLAQGMYFLSVRNLDGAITTAKLFR